MLYRMMRKLTDCKGIWSIINSTSKPCDLITYNVISLSGPTCNCLTKECSKGCICSWMALVPQHHRIAMKLSSKEWIHGYIILNNLVYGLTSRMRVWGSNTMYGTTQQELDMPSTYIAQMWYARAPYNTITNPAMLIIYQIIID